VSVARPLCFFLQGFHFVPRFELLLVELAYDLAFQGHHYAVAEWINVDDLALPLGRDDALVALG
jgi:hypothetical protein